jgi:glycosyltransferase involved in cell wall biosynthesis
MTTPVTTPSRTSEIRFSGIVVCLNEASHLRKTLGRLQFCEDILLVDLGSTDGSQEIGREMGAKVVQHELVPYGEFARVTYMPTLRNEWVVGVDPDEVLPEGTAALLRATIGANPDVALITMHFQYYFRGKPLHGTRWSTIGKPIAMHTGHSRINTNVHSGCVISPGYKAMEIPVNGPDTQVEHYWCDTYKQLFEKHNRYLKYEGKAKYDRGDRFSWGAALWDVLRSLKNNLIKDRGIFCGSDGIFLSFFHAWYVLNTHISLRRYQRRQLANTSAGNVPIQS